MSLNWVMLDNNEEDYVPLPREKTLFTSSKRTALSLQSANSFPGKEPFSLKCGFGKAIITNHRVIYLPSPPTSTFQSFGAPILSLQDTRVTAPFFGPNVWEGVLLPTPGGGFPPHHHFLQLKITFKDGGAFDFSTLYERMKESAGQAAEFAQESGRGGSRTGVVDLEPLPAYEENADSPSRIQQLTSPPQATATANSTSGAIQRPTPIHPSGVGWRTTSEQPSGNDEKSGPSHPQRQSVPPPDGPPPGYDEVEENAVVHRLEDQARNPD